MWVKITSSTIAQARKGMINRKVKEDTLALLEPGESPPLWLVYHCAARKPSSQFTSIAATAAAQTKRPGKGSRSIRAATVLICGV